MLSIAIFTAILSACGGGGDPLGITEDDNDTTTTSNTNTGNDDGTTTTNTSGGKNCSLSAQKFDALIQGTTIDNIKGVLGCEPSSYNVNTTIISDATFSSGNGSIFMQFINGKMSDAFYDASNPNTCSLSIEKFNSLQKGMTLSAIENVIGCQATSIDITTLGASTKRGTAGFGTVSQKPNIVLLFDGKYMNYASYNN